MVCLGCLAVYALGAVALLVVILKLYIKLTTAWCRSQTCLVGKTAIVTGANTGIGYETALDFAKRGARVILACRSQQRANEARSRIIEATGNDNVVVKLLDLTSLKSVRSFAEDIIKTEKRLDILVNNAGLSMIPEIKTEDGIHMLMQVNHFSHFLLTNLLVGLLKNSAPSRIVNVSSLLAKFSKLDLEKINDEHGMGLQYNNSKLCNILFTKELAKRLDGTGVTAYSLHPGTVKTEIFRNMNIYTRPIFGVIANVFFKTCEEGAQTTIHVAVAKGLEEHNGGHFDRCKLVPCYKKARDPGQAKKLWEISEDLVKLKPEELQF